MIRDDQENGTEVRDATVVSLSAERRARRTTRPRLHPRRGASPERTLAEIGGAGPKERRLLHDMARGYAAIQGSKFIKAVRKLRGYSQAELAQLIEQSQARISQWENMQGSGETISLVNLFMIAEACDFELKLAWEEKPRREVGSRRKEQSAHEKQGRRTQLEQSSHDQGEM